MRLICIFVLLVASLAGCRSAAPVPLPPFDPAQAFAALPSPNELLSAQPHHANAAVKQTSSHVVHMCGDLFSDAPAAQNVTRNELKHTCVLDGETAELTYCFFSLHTDYLNATSDFIDAVSAEIDWPTKVPDAPEGLWLGLPNYTAGRWDWYGPLSETPQWLEPAGGQIRGQAGSECFAFVNYSSGNATLKSLNLSCSDDEEEAEEYLYYCGLDAAHPEYAASLWLVNADGLSNPDPQSYGSEDKTESEPCFAMFNNQQAIGFAMAATAADPTSIWWQEISTGTGHEFRTEAATNIVPAGWRSDGGAYLWRKLLPTGVWQLMVTDIVLSGDAQVTFPDLNIVSAAWYDSETEADYSAIFSMRIEGPPTRCVIACVRVDGELPNMEVPQVIVDNGTESAIDPLPFTMHDGQGELCYGFVYSTRPTPGDTNELFAWLGGPDDDVDPRPLLHDEANNLRYPAVSPDGTRLAFVSFAPGANTGTLYVTDFINPNLSTAALLAEEVTSRAVWYDPQP